MSRAVQVVRGLCSVPWILSIFRSAIPLLRLWVPPLYVSIQRGGGMYITAGSTIGRTILRTGRYEPETERLLEELLVPGGMFIDLGCNIGYFSRIASDLVGPRGRVLSVDGDSRPLELLQRTVSRESLSNIEVMQAVIHRDRRECLFHRNRDAAYSALGEVREEVDALPVSTVRVDDLMDRIPRGVPVVVKMDLEGFELEAARGMTELLREIRPQVICEVVGGHLAEIGQTPGDLFRLFRTAGYEATSLERRKPLDPGDLPGDGCNVWFRPLTPG